MYDHGHDVIQDHRHEVESIGLWYDSDRLMLIGVYEDELTAYRARRGWIEALALNFLLEERHDFGIRVRPAYGGKRFKVRCDFLTACGRYAFWRLTNNQAPEVQFLLETSHLPHIREDEMDRFSETQEEFRAGSEIGCNHASAISAAVPKLRLDVAFERLKKLGRRLIDGVLTRHSSAH